MSGAGESGAAAAAAPAAMADLSNEDAWEALQMITGKKAVDYLWAQKPSNRVTHMPTQRVFESPQSALLATLGAAAAGEGVARADRGNVVRQMLANIASEYGDCELPSKDELQELEILANTATEMGVDFAAGAGAGGARRKTRRANSRSKGRRIQSGGAYFKNLYELLKSYCGLGAAVHEDIALRRNLDLVARRVSVDIQSRNAAQVRGMGKKVEAFFTNGQRALVTSAVLTNLSRGESSWIYRLAVAGGGFISAVTPSTAGLGTAMVTAGKAAAAIAGPTAIGIAAAAGALLAWRSIKYAVGGVGSATMGFGAAVKTALRPGAVNKSILTRYQAPLGTAGPSMAQRAGMAKKDAQTILLKYLSGILFDDPEHLIKIRNAQAGADKERTAEQLSEIVRQGFEGVRSSIATRGAAESARSAIAASKAAKEQKKFVSGMAAAMVGKNSNSEEDDGTGVFPGPGVPRTRVEGSALGSRGLGVLAQPPGSAAPPGVFGEELKRRTGAAAAYGSKERNAAAAAAAEAAAKLMEPPGAKKKRFGPAPGEEGPAARSGSNGAGAHAGLAPPAARSFSAPAASAGLAGLGALAAAAAAEEGEGEAANEEENSNDELNVEEDEEGASGGGRRSRRHRKSTRKHRRARSKRRSGMTKKRGGRRCGLWARKH